MIDKTAIVSVTLCVDTPQELPTALTCIALRVDAFHVSKAAGDAKSWCVQFTGLVSLISEILSLLPQISVHECNVLSEAA